VSEIEKAYPHFLSNTPLADTAAMKKEPVLVESPDSTEALLQSLIAECHAIIRDDVMPAARAMTEDFERRRYYESVVALVGIAAGVGDTLARLRGGAMAESRQRITVERIETVPAQPLLAIPDSVRTGVDRGRGE
jgi:hypothetical protein